MIKKITAILAVVIALVSFGTATSAEEQTTTDQEVNTTNSISWWWE